MNNFRNRAMLNDERIFEAALYQESNGITVKIKDVNTVNNRFAQFKKYIMRGSMTLSELEDRVYQECGVITNEPASDSISDLVRTLKKITDERSGSGQESQKSEQE